MSQDKKENKYSEEHSGKLHEVPFTAIKAYIDKYKGMGRNEEKHNTVKPNTEINQSKVNPINVTRLTMNKPGFKGPALIKDNSKPIQETMVGAGIDMQTDLPPTQELKRKSKIFYPLSESEGSSDGSSEDEENMEKYERIEHDYNGNYEEFAPRLQNLILRNVDPHDDEFHLIDNAGTNKMSYNNLEYALAERAKFTMVNPQGEQLVKTRFDQLTAAQQNAAQEITNMQPGDYMFDEQLAMMMEGENVDNTDLEKYREYFQKATEESRNFISFFDTVLRALERNNNFDLQFAHAFSIKFASYLATFLTAANADFIVAILEKQSSSVNVVARLIEMCYTSCKQKQIVLNRQIELQNMEGIILGYDDSKLQMILTEIQKLELFLNQFQHTLKNQNSMIDHSKNLTGALKASGVAKDLHSIRKTHVTQIAKNSLHNKVGGAMGQVMSERPSNEEMNVLHVSSSAKMIGANDNELRHLRLILCALIKDFRTKVQDCTFVDMTPLNDLERLLNFSTYSGPMASFANQTEPVDLMNNSGADIWLNELQALQTGAYSFSNEQKIVLAQGYILASKFSEEKCEQILTSIARRIGIDPLAPKIITAELKHILAEFGYYIEENVGIVQAMEQLSVKAKKTAEMDQDLENIISNYNLDSTFTDKLLNSIIANFAAPFSANQTSDHNQEVLKNYTCPACNHIFSENLVSIPLTLECGDIQCLGCSTSLKSCFICKAAVNNVPDSPALYNPTMHAPINFAAGVKINATNLNNYFVKYLTSNSIQSSFNATFVEAIAFLNQIASELYMYRGLKNMSTDDKVALFFNNIIKCENSVQLLKNVIMMIPADNFESVMKLCQKGLQIVDMYQDAKTIKVICTNVVGALVSASKLPQQALLCEALLTRDSQAMNFYCSAQNITTITDLYQSRKQFFMSSHAFNYNDVFPLALNLIASTIEALESEEFDDVIPTPIRIFILKEYQDFYVNAQLASESQDYTDLALILKKLTKLYYNELLVYLKPISLMSDSAQLMIKNLTNQYGSSLLAEVEKKYPFIRDVEVDDTLIDLKYTEQMINSVAEQFDKIYDESITSAKTALEKEAEFNAAVDANSHVELLRQKLILPGIKIDIPTDSSVLKNFPPYFTAVATTTGGNNPALPLYQFMMSDDSFLDNPFNVNVCPAMELAHTEGKLFYTGYDGFLEEYSLQTFDPHIFNTAGVEIPPNRIIEQKTILDDSVVINPPSINMPPADLGKLSLMEQLRYEKEKAEQIKKENAAFYSNLGTSIIDSAPVQVALTAMFGVKAPIISGGIKHILPYIVNWGQTYNAKPTYNSHPSDSMTGAGPFQSNANMGTAGLSDADKAKIEETQRIQKEAWSKFGGSMHPVIAHKKEIIAGRMNKILTEHKDKLKSSHILKPIGKELTKMKMRKNLHDLHDSSVSNHNRKQAGKLIEEKAPYCGHCGSRSHLRATTNNPEVVCNDCYKGKGITPNRKIMTQNNSEYLQTSTHPNLDHISNMYNSFLIHNKNGGKMTKIDGAQKLMKANGMWEHIKNTARPYFKQDPDDVINHFSSHRITEPFNNSAKNYLHHLKNTSLLAGKMHSMLHVEKDHMDPKAYDNLRHNYLWHIGHLPDKKGKGLHPNVVRAGSGFTDLVNQIDENSTDVKMLANALV